MATKLYVGNLPFSTTSDELAQIFAEAGEVAEANVITDKYSGRSRGFGFVEMKTEEEAKKAIEMFNGKKVGDRDLKVNEAKPMKPREERPRSY